MALRNLFKKENTKPSARATKINGDTRSGEWRRVLRRPVISEKASMQSEKGTYSFFVLEQVNKHMVAKAVADQFGVDVVSVRVINTPYKKVRKGRTTGRKGGYKKVFVTLKPDQKIELA